ncbi:beta-ketoacyl-ACP synthase [Candidatus Colwellia aromaticivorans]|uniref:beta-ketoacyl-ACP synthase n=1 Tax=Candidatus Colwellia aromaticivorans TaxID=2267621 RepID=UPI000DF4B44C|nr:beta-ketoacyl-ACP synthase [Candidatus Colwellia aromaticivorans]
MLAASLHDLGIICSLGTDKNSVLKNLTTQTDEEFLSFNTRLLVNGEPLYVGQVNGELPSMDNEESHFNSRNNQLALAALIQIMPTIERLKAQKNSARIGVVIGTSTSGILEGEQARASLLATGDMPQAFHYSSQEMIAPAQFIASKVDAQGPVYSISTACSSSAKALHSAKMILESDLADIVICGGVDTLSQLPSNGFKSLESTAKSYCNPFGSERDGINIGEGAALFVMSQTKDDIKLLSVGESSDAYHVSAPEPEGVGALSSMKQAVENANISAEQLNYLNLHGTGTPKNDDMEAKAVSAFCQHEVLAGSTKRFTGHTLGAAGAIEAGLTWLLLSKENTKRLIPENKNNGNIDPTLNSFNVSSGESVDSLSMCLSNSFAFGGSNISLILGTSFE